MQRPRYVDDVQAPGVYSVDGIGPVDFAEGSGCVHASPL